MPRLAPGWVVVGAVWCLSGPEGLCELASEEHRWLAPLIITCHENWGLTHPHPFRVLPSGAIVPDAEISQFLHGIRNHPELHSPIRLQVTYPEGGQLIVRVIQTSGYGGAGLRISLDGVVVLDRIFPGETNTVLGQYAGEYAVEVPAGEHEIVLDNQAADWTRIERLVLTNYCPWRVEVDHSTRIVARVHGMHGQALTDAHVVAETAGRAFELTHKGDGIYRSVRLDRVLERGTYPVVVTGRCQGEALFTTRVTVLVRRKRLMLRRVAFPRGERPEVEATFHNEAGGPVEGAAVSVTVGRHRLALAPTGEPGHYRGRLPDLPPGRYPVRLSAQRPAHSERTWLVVYEPRRGPGRPEQMVRLRRDGWFELASGEPFIPLGFATIHVFQPTFDAPTIEGWFESAWNLAPMERVADWLALLSTQGINVIRIGLTVKGDGVPGDMGGWVQPEFVERFRGFLDLCGSLGLRVIPVLYWGHWTTFGLEGVPAYEPLMKTWQDWYVNAQAIRLQQEFTRQMVRPFAADPRILAWEPMNEIRPEVDGSVDVPVAWTNAICRAIRQADRDHLITISPLTMDSYYHVHFARHSGADFINYHFYADYTTPPRGIADRVAVCTRLNQLGGKPAILGEAGVTGAGRDGLNPLTVRLATRDCYWASVLSGSPGVVGWDGHTTAPEETRMLGQILRRTGWYGRRRTRAPVVVTFSDLRADLWSLIEAQGRLTDRGVWYDVVRAGGEANKYRVRLTPREVPTRLEELPRLIETTAPYAVIPFVADEGRWLLAYVRNEGSFDGFGCRWPRKADLHLQVNMSGRHQMVVWDLERRRRCAETQFTDRGQFTVSGTRADYVLWCERL